MNTSLPLLNVITGSQAANGTRSANPADSFTADVPFNQVLNSQVSTRNQERQSEDKPQAAAPAPSQPAQAQANTAASKSSSTDDAGKKPVSDKDEQDDDEDTTTQASAELLALVANIAQNAVKPVTEGKSENTDADLLAQAKRGGGKLSLADEQQALMEDGKASKIDLAAVQNSLAAARGKLDAAAEQAHKASAAEANPSTASTKGEKPAIDLGADAKAAPKEDATTLAAHAQLGKAAPETASSARQELPQAATSPVILPAMQQTLAANQPQAVFAPAYSDKIQANVGSAGWNQALGTKITWMASAGMQSASLSLNPPDLGPMQVVLHVHNQQADATFITAQPEVKQALEAAMPKLREMMDQAGIQLGQATVNTGMPNQQQGANDQQQARGSAGSFGKDQEGEAAVSAAAATTTTAAGLGLVDTFA